MTDALKPRAICVIVLLNNLGPVYPRVISKAMGETDHQTYNLLNAMEAEGLIMYPPSMSRDSRLLGLTDLGKKYLDARCTLDS